MGGVSIARTFRQTQPSSSARLLQSAALAGVGAAATVAYGTLVERNAFTLREATLPVLAPGSPTIRVLHLSDLHMLPRQGWKQHWVHALEGLEPDLVVNTGDNLADPRAVPSVVQALGDLLARPGLFVFGSNDYFGPTPKNPLKYFAKNHKRVHGEALPWTDLRAAFAERGWLDATHTRREITVSGLTIQVAGVDDPHLHRDRYDLIAGPADARAGLRLGLTHSPEPRVLDRFAADGYDLVLAGHTHGGQLCLPGVGALVTNSGLDRSRVKGPSRWGQHMQLYVSAGLGTSPYAPMRLFCRPEASLLTLVPTKRREQPQADVPLRPAARRAVLRG